MTSLNNGGIPNHGYKQWIDMFNSRQKLLLSQILKAIVTAPGYSQSAKDILVGAFQQYLRNQNLFCIWNKQADQLEPMFSNNNFHPKTTSVENNFMAAIGRGNWLTAKAATLDGLSWAKNPWETLSVKDASELAPELISLLSGKSHKAWPNDSVKGNTSITCGSSTELSHIGSEEIDLVITDPPFGGLLHYSELSDFFYVWMRLAFKKVYPDYFSTDYTPKTLEAVSNRARNPDDPDAFYKRLLTECWKEAKRILKPGGILSFTFHHSEDGPWVDVLESLFDAGFYLEATYPIRSDETKGEGAKPGTFGSQTIEYDIIHVCRKRTGEPQKISWPRLRRQILADVRQLHLQIGHQEVG